MQKHCTFLVLILILIISSSCQAQTPVDTPAPSATPAPIHTQPPPSTVAATATVVPPPPTVTQSVPAGLYTMYAGPEGIWISKPDGTSVAKLTDLGIDRMDLRRVRSPMGDRMALIVQTEEGFDLVEVRIPGGETETIAHLYSITED